MAGNIVSFNSAEPAPGEPDVDVIETLEEVLEQARRGEIVAVGIAAIRPNGSGATWRDTPWSRSLALLGACRMLMARLEGVLTDGD